MVLVDPNSGGVQKIIVLQYNPDTLTRTLQPQSVKEGGDRSEALRVKLIIAREPWEKPGLLRR